MSKPFQRLAVIGLGLLGGSLAFAAKKRGLAHVVVGTGRREAALAYAHTHGFVDAAFLDPREAVRGADLVVLATPIETMAEQVRAFAPSLAPGAIVTDVGSLKGVVAEQLPGLLPTGVAFVGSHPMAGSHLSGVENAREDLFEGAACIVLQNGDAAAVARIRHFWEELGARVVLRTAHDHDAEVAWVSHVPHAVAFAFAHALQKAPKQAGELSGPGFRDFTRIARSDAALWTEILVANRKALLGPLQAVVGELNALIGILATSQESGVASGTRGEIAEAGQVAGMQNFLGEARTALQALSREENE